MKLTNTVRDDIKDTLLTKRFADEEARLEKESAALFALVVHMLWGKLWPIISQIPVEKLYTSSNLYAFETHLNAEYPLPVPNDLDTQQEIEKVLRNTDVGKRLKAYKAAYDKFREDKRNLSREITNALAAITTYKRLYELWPELRTVTELQEPILAKPPTAMVVNLKSLNKKLGLPVKEVA